MPIPEGRHPLVGLLPSRNLLIKLPWLARQLERSVSLKSVKVLIVSLSSVACTSAQGLNPFVQFPPGPTRTFHLDLLRFTTPWQLVEVEARVGASAFPQARVVEAVCIGQPFGLLEASQLHIPSFRVGTLTQYVSICRSTRDAEAYSIAMQAPVGLMEATLWPAPPSDHDDHILSQQLSNTKKGLNNLQDNLRVG